MRQDGYAPIRDYAAIGDGRTVALVALDGSVDWLCLPDADSASVFARILDDGRGGSFRLEPTTPFEATRTYREATNVLETTFRTATGSARLTDAMTVARPGAFAPARELVRRVEGIAGSVELLWHATPRFEYGTQRGRVTRRGEHVAVTHGRSALAIGAWGTETLRVDESGVAGRIRLREGESATLALAAADAEPLVLPGRDDTEGRLAATEEFWRSWAARINYSGRWRDAVVRSALALKLLVFAPTGAMLAAATTSLPEAIGGGRNWDYRFTWVRDAALTLRALLDLGFDDEPAAFIWWLTHATALTHPALNVLYTTAGAVGADETELEHLEGYRRSRPVRVGNGATGQTQLDVYGPVLDALWRFVDASGRLDAERGRRLAKIADWVAEHWQERDSGIWEVRGAPTHFTHSKAMCWVALDRACKLAERGVLPDHRERWQRASDAIRAFVDERCVDSETGAYVRADDLREPDGSLLTLPLYGYDEPTSPRTLATLDAVRTRLGDGALVDRYAGEDGVEGEQGVFVTCSFWFAAALARAGRVTEAVERMDELVALANDVGLFAEEIDREGTFLGNFPQALVHLALVEAAIEITRAESNS